MRVTLAVLGLAAPAVGWVTRSQSVYGAQIDEIKQMMRGEVVKGVDGIDRVPQAQLGYLWYAPADTNSTRGLGGGITWAWDDALCDMIQPLFKEDIFGAGAFIGCNEIKSAVARAFDKWSANNRFIKFLDVTEECKLIGRNYGPPTGATQPETYSIPADSNNPSQWSAGTGHGACPLAEIWVTSMASSSRRSLRAASGDPNLPDLVDFDEDTAEGILPAVDGNGETMAEHARNGGRRLSEGGYAVATAYSHPRYAYDFRYTNGKQPYWAAGLQPSQGEFYRPVVESFMGTFSFNTNVDQVCWYLDGVFCSGFHELKTSMGSAESAQMLVYGICYGCMALGILFYICFFAAVCIRFTGMGDIEDEDGDGLHDDDEDGDGVLSFSERAKGVLRQVSHYNPIGLTLFVMLILIPPLVVTRLFEPCFGCYDFEAAALHEIGHFLGLGHPDNIPANWAYPTYAFAGPAAGNNSYNAMIAAGVLGGTRLVPNEVCQDPWMSVAPGVPASATDMAISIDTTGNYPFRDAQMEAFTQNNPQPCLRDDDVEGLQTMYPDCADTALYVNVCHTVALNIGTVRIAFYVLLPTIIALMCITIFNSIVHAFERREKERIFGKMSTQREQLAAIKAAKKAARKSQKKSSLGSVGAQSVDVQAAP